MLSDQLVQLYQSQPLAPAVLLSRTLVALVAVSLGAVALYHLAKARQANAKHRLYWLHRGHASRAFDA